MWCCNKIIERTKSFVIAVLFAAVIAGSWITESLALDAPTGEVLLKVFGNVAESNNEGEAWFDLEMLQSLGTTEFQTESPWTDGPGNFKGVRIKDIMDLVGASGKNFEAQAVNKYKKDFAGIDYEKYPIIIAWELNNELLTIRTLGPLWIMFPFSDYPEIDTMENRNASVWQLLRLKVY